MTVSQAVRNLRRDPALLLSATLTLAVAIAANTTLFSVANSILIKPLPYPDSKRIAWISELSGPAQNDIGTAPDYFRIREGNRVFSDVGAFTSQTMNRTGIDRPEQIDSAQVTSSFFNVMSMQPMMGRYIAPEEEASKAAPVAVVSYAYWRSHLGADPGIVGQTITLDRLPRSIIGVMPQGFDYPRGTAVWTPMHLDLAMKTIDVTRPIFLVSMVARLKPEASDASATADLDQLAQKLRAEYHVFPTKFRWDLAIAAHPLQEHTTGKLRPALLLLSGAAAFVLLIACVNLANLMLARAANRRRELAVRVAMGARRSDIVAHVLAESVVLALPGGAAGMAIAAAAVRVLNAMQPAILSKYPAVHIDLQVLAFTAGLTCAASVLFGLAPAWMSSRVPINEALKTGVASAGAPPAAKLRKLLVVAELAVSLVLLAGAGLFARTFWNLAHTPLGFSPENLLTFRVTPAGFSRDNSQFYRAVLERVRATPGVESASVLQDVPLSDIDFWSSGRIRVVGRPPVPFPDRPVIHNTVVSAEFFETMRIPLLTGRWFDARDSVVKPVTSYGTATNAPVIVNEALVRRLFPNEDPLGHDIVFGPDTNFATWTIIGVVGDVRGSSLGDNPPEMAYRSLDDSSRLFHASIVIRTHGDPRALIRAAEDQVHAVDRDLPIFDVKTMDERRAAALAPEQFQLAVIGAFSFVALLLAAAGVYGVVMYLVAQRTREIGIRVAIGAAPRDILRLVLREAIVMIAAGTVLGAGAAAALSRYVRSAIHGTATLDAASLAWPAIALALVVLLAAWPPARKASRIDPMRALREG